MKLAIVSIEDKRFAEHNGVDWQGTLTGLSGYLSGNLDTRGGSTLEQQYVKNYQLLVIAQTDAEKRAAIETTPARKLREIRMALTLDKTFTKPEILTRYLNLVSFGNGAFGIQDAAQTYFGINASELNWQQAALLAGMVQSTSTLDPYTNPDGALARRNLVLDTMIENLPEHADELRAAKEQPLGILPQPNELPRGCIAAGDRAFFCDYALEYLARAGISKEQVAKGGYLIKTTLDPDVQIPLKSAIDGIASPDLQGVASVMSVIRPGKESHPVLAMASNRTYGLNTDAGETMQPQPFSLVGDGAGSTFKIFTTAAALEMGMGINATLDVPGQFQAKGLGSSDTPGCPKETWCVKNAGGYRGSMNVTDALATSPNTAFAKLITQVGVQRSVDMAVRLGHAVVRAAGHRPRLRPAEQREPGRLHQAAEPGFVHAGPVRDQPAGVRQRGRHARLRRRVVPAQPDRQGFRPQRQGCRGHHRNLRTGGAGGPGQHAGQRDEQGRPGLGHRRRVGGRGGLGPADVGQDRHHRGAPLVGVPRVHEHAWPAASYIYDDSTTPGDLCSFPLRQCGSGNLFGGNEPARTWFTAMKPIANNYGPVALPPTDPRYVDGAPGSRVPSVAGMTQDSARQRLKEAGFQVADQANPVNSASSYGTVVGRRRRGRRCPARSSRSRSAMASRRHRLRRRPVRSQGFRLGCRRRSARRSSRFLGCHRSPCRCSVRRHHRHRRRDRPVSALCSRPRFAGGSRCVGVTGSRLSACLPPRPDRRLRRQPRC